jgi:dolichol kinase
MNELLEIRRKIIHLCLGVGLVFVLYKKITSPQILLIALIACFLLFYISRFRKIFFIEWLLRKFERPEARKSFPGKGFLFYLLGSIISLLLFERNIAYASIIILAVGDSVPNLVGLQFRNIRHPLSEKKYLEGVIAGIVLSSLAATIFVRWYEAILASTVAIFFESMDRKWGIDDNIIVPLVAGCVIWMVRLIF